MKLKMILVAGLLMIGEGGLAKTINAVDGLEGAVSAEDAMVGRPLSRRETGLNAASSTQRHLSGLLRLVLRMNQPSAQTDGGADALSIERRAPTTVSPLSVVPEAPSALTHEHRGHPSPTLQEGLRWYQIERQRARLFLMALRPVLIPVWQGHNYVVIAQDNPFYPGVRAHLDRLRNQDPFGYQCFLIDNTWSQGVMPFLWRTLCQEHLRLRVIQRNNVTTQRFNDTSIQHAILEVERRLRDPIWRARPADWFSYFYNQYIRYTGWISIGEAGQRHVSFYKRHASSGLAHWEVNTYDHLYRLQEGERQFVTQRDGRPL